MNGGLSALSLSLAAALETSIDLDLEQSFVPLTTESLLFRLYRSGRNGLAKKTTLYPLHSPPTSAFQTIIIHVSLSVAKVGARKPFEAASVDGDEVRCGANEARGECEPEQAGTDQGKRKKREKVMREPFEVGSSKGDSRGQGPGAKGGVVKRVVIVEKGLRARGWCEGASMPLSRST